MKIFSLLLTLCLMIPAVANATGREGIAVVVNSDAVTNSDVNERVKMIAISTGIPQTPEATSKLRPQIIDMLIEESLKMQEARRVGVKVSKEEIDAGFAEIAANNNIPPEEFKKMVQKSGIRMRTMNDQIEAQIAWGKVVQRKVRSTIEVSDSDIDAELEKIKRKLGQQQYRLSQIYLPLNDKVKEKDLISFANKLVEQLRAQPEAFGKAAQQFSQAPGAKSGGDIGWVEKGQLPKEVDDKLDQLTENTVSDPIKGQNVYYILMLKEKRVLGEESLPKREDVLQRVGTQRLERAARRYMLDLRATAFIETRT